MKNHLAALTVSSALAFAACASPSSDASPEDDVPGRAELRSIEQDLGPGAEGAEVTAVQRYLTDFGYFPNAALARDYPRWKPSIATAPRAGVFDAHTELAVREFQRRHALPQTGTVDASTRGLMQGARCGVPDGVEEVEGHDKFAHVGTPWTNRNLKWKLSGSVPSPLTSQGFRDVIGSALLIWSLETGLSFTEVTGSSAADIVLSFGTLSNPSALASTFPPPNGDVTFSTAFSWSTAATTPAGSADLLTVALHELGHSLGIHHSSVQQPAGTLPVMWWLIDPINTQRRSLRADDKVAISALYDQWGNHTQLQQPLPGSAYDIAVSANNDVWGIGTIANQAGFRIYKWIGGSWAEASGNGGALRIALAPDGTAWVCDSNGNIWTHAANHTSGGWTQRPGCAIDLGVGANGAVWGIGCPTTPGGRKIYKWNGSNWDPDSANGGAVRISVDQNGRPWAVNDVGGIYKRSSDNPSVGSWSQVTSPTSVGATDISVSPSGYAWIISNQTTGGGYKIFVRDDQAAGTGTGNDTPARAEWIQVPGGGISISAGPFAVWATNNTQQIWKQIEKSVF